MKSKVTTTRGGKGFHDAEQQHSLVSSSFVKKRSDLQRPFLDN